MKHFVRLRVVATTMKTITNYKAYHDKRSELTTTVFMFSSDACPDCAYAERFMPAIEALYPSIQFFRVKRSDVLKAFKQEKIEGVPSFIVYQKKQRLGVYTDRNRKNVIDVQTFIENALNHAH